MGLWASATKSFGSSRNVYLGVKGWKGVTGRKQYLKQPKKVFLSLLLSPLSSDWCYINIKHNFKLHYKQLCRLAGSSWDLLHTKFEQLSNTKFHYVFLSFYIYTYPERLQFAADGQFVLVLFKHLTHLIWAPSKENRLERSVVGSCPPDS